MKIHGRMGAGMCKVFGATLAVRSAAVENMPASFERESFVFIFTPVRHCEGGRAPPSQ
jgi:hypothetical protein